MELPILLTPCGSNTESQDADTFVDESYESERTSSPSDRSSPSGSEGEVLNNLNLEQANLEQQLSVVKAKKTLVGIFDHQ